jgi:hypothetical protein
MGQPKPRPDAAMAAGRYPAGVLEDPKPVAQRFAYSADTRLHALRRTDPPRASQPAPQAATREATAPAAGRSGRIRLLHAGLILAAMVPSVILGALWLGLISIPRSAPAVPLPDARTVTPSAVLTAPDRIEAIAGEDVSFPIALDGTDGVPSRSVIAIKGLPQGSNFSDGRPYGDREWSLRPDQIGDLDLVLPAGANGEFKLGIALIAPDDRVIAEAATLLEIAPAPAPADPVATEASSGPEPAVSEATAAIPDGDGVAALAVAPEAGPGDSAAPSETPATTQKDSATSGDAPAAAVKPSQDGESGLGSVQPSVFVNLREGPSSSAPVVGVIAKGAKLPVLDRKRGWVQVVDPATSKKGWIYSGNLLGEAKTHYRGKRAAPAEAAPDSQSFWGRIGSWLSPS